MDEDNNGGDAMQLPRKGAMEWNLNTVVTVGGVVFGAIVTAFGWGVIYNKMTTNDDKAVSAIAEVRQMVMDEKTAREKRGIVSDARFSAIEEKIPQFQVIGMQIQRLTEISAANEQAIQATNERFSRYVESQSGKLDLIISRVSDLTTEVRVVQSQLKDGNPQRTRMPINPVIRSAR